mmetsp:Transcript_12799/g.44489  ORF Transcript_12799/g.44489 Transcript_12799/m.44489 type:complete len:114 (-) Transcript_12799:849-1190(-)
MTKRLFVVRAARSPTTLGAGVMSGMLAKAKEAASGAADKAKALATKGKLEAEIMYKEKQIKSAKEEMGVAMYDAMLNGDQAAVQAAFEAAKAKIEPLAAEVAAKRAEIAALTV